MSKGDVNIQNFPKRSNIQVRDIITAPEDHFIVSFDYGQLEARLIAMASKDTVYCNDIWEGDSADTHMKWSLEFTDKVPHILDKATIKEFRGDVKTNFVFASFYGSAENSIVEYYLANWNVPPLISSSIYKNFWETYIGVKQWQQELIKFYNEHGYTQSLTGRRRHGPISVNKIINFPIQSSASFDICLCAGDRLSELAYALKKPQYQYVINIHDDLTFYIPEATLEEDILFIAREMCRPVYDFIIVPLQVECSVGKHWGRMEEIAKWDSKDFKFMERK